MATTRTVTPNDDKIKTLLVAGQRLTGYINELEGRRADLPAGAFKHLTTAENMIINKRAKLEKDGGR